VTASVPDRPLLAPWYRLVENGDRLLLEHGQSVVALEGAAVVTLLPPLLRLLDGTRTVDDLVERLGVVARPAIEHALEILASNGLLVEGPDAAADLRATAYAFAAAYNLSPACVIERLDAAVIGVVGEGAAAPEIARHLHAAGVGQVRRCEWDDDGGFDLAVVTPSADETGLLGAWNRVTLSNGLRWLLMRPFDGRFASVGPLVVPGETCCYECLVLRRAANLEYGAELIPIEAVPLTAVADPAFDALVVALSAHVALRWILGHDRTIPGVLYAVEQQPLPTITDHSVLRVPRCPACSPAERFAPALPWHAAEAVA
jgi:bacteriocin biosynthesis cyclodehydratase domain-containing protein